MDRKMAIWKKPRQPIGREARLGSLWSLADLAQHDAASSLHWPCRQAENLGDPDCKKTVQFIRKGEQRKGRPARLPLASQTSRENQLRSTHGRENGRHQVSFHQRMPTSTHSVNWTAVTVAARRHFGKSHLQLQKVHLKRKCFH